MIARFSHSKAISENRQPEKPDPKRISKPELHGIILTESSPFAHNFQDIDSRRLICSPGGHIIRLPGVAIGNWQLANGERAAVRDHEPPFAIRERLRQPKRQTTLEYDL